MKLNKRETALVLAGLRLLQESMAHKEILPSGIHDILVDADMEHCPLERIDRLCEKINVEP
jgi:hypothetical protein